MSRPAGALHWQTAQAALARRDLGVAASALQALLEAAIKLRHNASSWQ
ncbi:MULTISPECIES: hypothetical protein [Xanthomonas]|uniref:Uncharacterized protein n=1 Tax=Xanthomonas campestris pv. phaseoli TaxID=317013 RepID=A0A7Z7IWK4_XANCH|nr:MULTISPECIES: hypothetical protein [Xanthomonas]ATB60652.1 hypothetical protein CKU38_04328 [Xanthomonas citri pv. fuscans]MCW3194826.1 hypothetical protein [Xanthomonas citri pv. fuscans]QTD88032.1 hypothetical protein XcfCFBP6988P_23785 [Xanthomonas citri pv. phaseoli var. fuscans]QTF14107.1 hypothetical protein XcfCFBP6989P_23700 [Xanthomonas citri pv. phaseoli var. fuscans]QTF14332.1 hypothetical protein XcfCFBP6991P_24455 [Xanthomonas citri pv. phaseoli var. fuscans]